MPYLLVFPLGWRFRRGFVSLWHKGVCALLFIKIHQQGLPVKDQRVLLAGNHLSYLDIPIIASCLDVTFVAKSDVASWPLFGFLARISQTAFIDRKPSMARLQKNELKERLIKGERILIFPEGTSTNGKNVKPFKTSLFEIAMDEEIREHCMVQPITISPSANKDGSALSSEQRDQYAWYGDMTLLPHLWKVFCQKAMNVDVIFHAPLLASEFPDRKLLANWAECRSRAGLEKVSNPMKQSSFTTDETTQAYLS
ncbi:lysophospholipid acyltransferase family protein [Candidatus Terasakiella magnetica]|uniref:lysophospholipid acyltransferase family protein n=1 Tax=Candidatus Terasakiella magnetica TaxID=1867952 RepID=UPI001F0A9AF9|nr:lysophospholipid acyltransferase family protein [Candidatus Terasakiella magnetica]